MNVKTAFLYGKINHELCLSMNKGLNYDKETIYGWNDQFTD